MLLLLDSEKELKNKDVLSILDKHIDNSETSEQILKEIVDWYAEKSSEKIVDFEETRKDSMDLFEKTGKLHDNLLEVFSYYFSSNNLEEFFDIIGSYVMEAKLKEIEYQQKDNIINRLEEKNAGQARMLDERQHSVEVLNDKIQYLTKEIDESEKNEKAQEEGKRLRKIFKEIIRKVGDISYTTIDDYLDTSAIDDFEKDFDRALEYYESRLASQDKSKLGYLKARNEIRELLKDPALSNDYRFLKSIQGYIDEMLTDLTKQAALSEASQKVFEVAEKWENAMKNGGEDMVYSSGNRDEYVENLLNGVQDLVEQYKEDLQNDR